VFRRPRIVHLIPSRRRRRPLEDFVRGMRVRLLLLAVSMLLAAAPARGQTASLPPPAASSLDRLAQAPLAPPPQTWDPYGPQALPTYAPQAPSTGWAPSAIGGQPVLGACGA